MAYLSDQLSDEERRQQEALGGGASAPPGGGGGAGGSSAPAATPSSGFTNLASYFNANKDAATTQGNARADELAAKAESSLRSDDPGAAMGTLGEINAAATPGGLASVSRTGGDPGYTAGMAGLDAYLGTRGAAPGRFEGLREHFGSRLGKVESAVEKPEIVPVEQQDSDWWGKINAYEDWRKRRAENLGEDYSSELPGAINTDFIGRG